MTERELKKLQKRKALLDREKRALELVEAIKANEAKLNFNGRDIDKELRSNIVNSLGIYVGTDGHNLLTWESLNEYFSDPAAVTYSFLNNDIYKKGYTSLNSFFFWVSTGIRDRLVSTLNLERYTEAFDELKRKAIEIIAKYWLQETADIKDAETKIQLLKKELKEL